nr:splicing factor u2af 50 kda subunit [Quercus suber]
MCNTSPYAVDLSGRSRTAALRSRASNLSCLKVECRNSTHCVHDKKETCRLPERAIRETPTNCLRRKLLLIGRPLLGDVITSQHQQASFVAAYPSAMSDRRYAPRDDRPPRRDRDDRRRSRSPRGGDRGGRSGGYGDRRNGGRDAGVDSYAGDRGYRDREREERYGGGRDGRGRGWRSGMSGGDRDRGERDRGDRDRGDRDRGDRDRERRGGGRDGRDRDDDRRRMRRDDRHDDYNGRAPGRDRGDRDIRGERDDMAEMDAQQRRAPRSSTPEQRKVKEPTPDLTDVVSVLSRKRRLTQWDIKPPGYDNVTAEQAKLSGMFPLPGAPRQQPMDPTRLQAFMNQPGNSAGSAALKPGTARQAKRLFVYNIPPGSNDASLADFFNLQLNDLNVIKGSDPCSSAQISKDGSYALLEFKSPEDATSALALDGSTMETPSNGADADMADGQGLSIKRPNDYIVPPVAPEGENASGVLDSGAVPDSPNKLLITKIGTYLEDEQVRELLEAFGELKHFVLAKDRMGGGEANRGWAFCEYSQSSVTNAAIEGLNAVEIGDMRLMVKKACVGVTQTVIGPGGAEMSVGAMSVMAGMTTKDVDGGRVLCLMNMITTEELMDPEEADEILEDVRDECSKYGQLEEVKMPRPTTGNRSSKFMFTGLLFLHCNGDCDDRFALCCNDRGTGKAMDIGDNNTDGAICITLQFDQHL